ncbi:MAG: hypothetical protein LUH03_09000 [Oscillospiraceae bacterium]|nr:hypothetical protein [Oscillospiraceae bacterium]
MSRKKKIAIAARIVFGILALASLVTCIYYIVEGSLSEVLSSMTLLLLSISLGYIYGRVEEKPEGVLSTEEKEAVKSHIGTDAVIFDDGEWYFEGAVDHSFTVRNGEIVLNTGDNKYIISNITPDSFTLRDYTGREFHARKK